ncbi:MAG: hypothetical protein ACRDK9_09175 [Solirubrobacterales bacterium]
MDVYQRRRLVALGGLAAVVVLIAVAIGQCGGDDEDPVPVTQIGGATGPGLASLPKDGLIEQADAICAETDAALEAISTANAARAARQEAEAATAELNDLQTLPPPEEDTETLAIFLGALEEQVRALGDKEVAAERGDETALAGIEEEVATAQADAEGAAEDFGFEICGDPSAGGDTDETDTGAATEPAPTEVAPTEPVAPAPTEPAPTVTPEGGATPDAPPAETGGDSGSGGVSP